MLGLFFHAWAASHRHENTHGSVRAATAPYALGANIDTAPCVCNETPSCIQGIAQHAANGGIDDTRSHSAYYMMCMWHAIPYGLGLRRRSCSWLHTGHSSIAFGSCEPHGERRAMATCEAFSQEHSRWNTHRVLIDVLLKSLLLARHSQNKIGAVSSVQL